jgi:hypothetical protein
MILTQLEDEQVVVALAVAVLAGSDAVRSMLVIAAFTAYNAEAIVTQQSQPLNLREAWPARAHDALAVGNPYWLSHGQKQANNTGNTATTDAPDLQCA